MSVKSYIFFILCAVGIAASAKAYLDIDRREREAKLAAVWDYCQLPDADQSYCHNAKPVTH